MSEKKRDMNKLLMLAAGSLALGATQLDASALQDYSNLGHAAKLRTALYQGGDLVMQGQSCGSGSCGNGSCGNGQCGSGSPHGGNCGSSPDNNGQGSCGQGSCG